MVTVLFSNVVGFSKLTEQDKAEKLIDDLDRFYYHFDETVKDLNIKNKNHWRHICLRWWNSKEKQD